MIVTPLGRIGRDGDARMASTNRVVSSAYRSAARVELEVGAEVRVVKETCCVDAPEKATDEIPSMAASHAAPLTTHVQHQRIRINSDVAHTVPELSTTVPRLSRILIDNIP